MNEDLRATSEEHEVESPCIFHAQGHEVLCDNIDNAFVYGKTKEKIHTRVVCRNWR